jgi:hypothetical protein
MPVAWEPNAARAHNVSGRELWLRAEPSAEGNCKRLHKHDSNHRRLLLNAERFRQFLLFHGGCLRRCAMPRGNLSTAHQAVSKRLRRFVAALRHPRAGVPEELLRKAEEELAHVAAVGSNEESMMADDKLNRGEPAAAGST